MTHAIAALLALLLVWTLGVPALEKYTEQRMEKFAFRSEEDCRKAVREGLVTNCIYRVTNGRSAMARPRITDEGAR